MLIFFKRTCSPCLAVRLLLYLFRFIPPCSVGPCFNLSVFHFPFGIAPRVTPSFRDCKGKRSFGLCKINNFYFFASPSLTFGVSKFGFFCRSRKLSFPFFSTPPHRLRSLAGCKGNKLFGSRKIKMKFFLNSLFNRFSNPYATFLLWLKSQWTNRFLSGCGVQRYALFIPFQIFLNLYSWTPSKCL